VLVAIVLAAAVILGGIIVVAMGKGGELSRERPDLPARADFRSWSDVADYRPPGALLGYHAAATEHALALIARTIAERDAEIDWLRRRLAEVQPSSPAPEVSPAKPEPPSADVTWQDGSATEPGVGSDGFCAPQPVGRGLGEDE
jgi:hypothetical protein